MTVITKEYPYHEEHQNTCTEVLPLVKLQAVACNLISFEDFPKYSKKSFL